MSLNFKHFLYRSYTVVLYSMSCCYLNQVALRVAIKAFMLTIFKPPLQFFGINCLLDSASACLDKVKKIVRLGLSAVFHLG